MSEVAEENDLRAVVGATDAGNNALNGELRNMTLLFRRNKHGEISPVNDGAKRLDAVIEKAIETGGGTTGKQLALQGMFTLSAVGRQRHIEECKLDAGQSIIVIAAAPAAKVA